MPLDLSGLVPGLRLANPWALGLLALVPVWYGLVRRSARRTGGLTFPLAGWAGRLPRSWRVRLSWLPDALRAAVLICLVLAAGRPQRGFERQKLTKYGVDIILALDVSPSMRAEDIRENRLLAAKNTILRFISMVESDRLGLIVFDGRALTQCPLTTDYGVLAELVKDTYIGMVGADGTAVGAALATAVYRFENSRETGAGEADAESARKQSRVVVLLTDGENNVNEVPPLEAAEMARVKGIKVHCIGLGSREPTTIPTYIYGRKVPATYEDGTLVLTQLDEALLEDIADHTGGEYFRATDAQALDSIYREIAEMERHEVEVENIVEHEERYLPLLAAALALLLVELLLRASVFRVTV